MWDESGQAAIEWTGATLVVAGLLALVAALGGTWGAVAGAGLVRSLRCAVLAGCVGEDLRLERAYGAGAGSLVRAFAPNLVYERGTRTLPVDFRRCRSHRCADAPDVPGLDVWRGVPGGAAATVFTHVVDRRPRGSLYVQYWLYYPDSTYNGTARAVGGLPLVSATPVGALARKVSGFHRDDWESYQLRVDPDGCVWARASAHNGYSGRRHWPNLNEAPDLPGRRRTGAWTPATTWTRVSRGSHAGHIVGGPGGERRTRADGLRLVPIETLPSAVRARAFAISPPWDKAVYTDPEATGT
jgi:hypothetical protein